MSFLFNTGIINRDLLPIFYITEQEFVRVVTKIWIIWIFIFCIAKWETTLTFSVCDYIDLKAFREYVLLIISPHSDVVSQAFL